MAGPPRITVVGSANVDLVARCERLPRPGETVTDASFERIPGGKGANQAVAAARLGARVRFVGRIGADDLVLQSLAREGVDTSGVRRDDGESGVALILVDAVDGTAAGDSFCAALVVSLLEGRGREEALVRACAAGAIAASRRGAQPSLPNAAEIDEILSR